jgi:hypothetical protein
MRTARGPGATTSKIGAQASARKKFSHRPRGHRISSLRPRLFYPFRSASPIPHPTHPLPLVSFLAVSLAHVVGSHVAYPQPRSHCSPDSRRAATLTHSAVHYFGRPLSSPQDCFPGPQARSLCPCRHGPDPARQNRPGSRPTWPSHPPGATPAISDDCSLRSPGHSG